LLRRQYVVVYLSLFPKAESTDLRLSIRHPNLITIQCDRFNLEEFLKENEINPSTVNLIAVVELPHQDWIPIITRLQDVGATIIYEVIDEWNSNLGAKWYNPATERAIIEKAHILTATAPILKIRLEEVSKRNAILVPNAVNTLLFNYRKKYPVPQVLEGTNLIITYIGALYGDWFDWNLLVKIALSFSQAKIIIIGDYRGQCKEKISNLHFIGLKPQTALPAYLAKTNVAIIPWKINDITRATSPIKLYEYLAMHVPVVAPTLPPLVGIPSVFLAGSDEEFIEAIRMAQNYQIEPAMIDQFINSNSWEARVSQLMELIDDHSWY